MDAAMVDTRRQARHAGRLYLITAVIAPIGLVVAPGRLIVSGDAAATAEHIRSAEWLLRAGIASELFEQAIGVYVVLALYQLFRSVDRDLARQMLVLGALVSVPIMFLNVVNEIAAMILIRGAGFLSPFDPAQREALAYLFLRLHSNGLNVASIFWGLWLFPFARLVMRSGFIPRILGVLMVIAGVGYAVDAFSTILLPHDAAARVSQVAMVAILGELPIIFWLAFWGARPQRMRAEV